MVSLLIGNLFVKRGILSVGASSDLTCDVIWCPISWTICGDNVILIEVKT